MRSKNLSFSGYLKCLTNAKFLLTSHISQKSTLTRLKANLLVPLHLPGEGMAIYVERPARLMGQGHNTKRSLQLKTVAS